MEAHAGTDFQIPATHFTFKYCHKAFLLVWNFINIRTVQIFKTGRLHLDLDIRNILKQVDGAKIWAKKASVIQIGHPLNSLL